MKNIYKIKLLLIALFVFNSCAIDDDEPVKNIIGDTVFSANTSFARVAAGESSYDMQVNLSGALPYTSRLTYTLDGVEMFADIDPNVTTGTITVDMPGTNVRTVVLKSVTALYASAAGYSASVSSNNTTAIANDGVGENGDMFVELSWDTGADIDMIMTESPAPSAPFLPTAANVVNYAGSVTPKESFTVTAATAAGDYSILITPWDTFSSPINFTLLTVAGSDVNMFSGTVASAAVGGSGGFFTPLTYGTVVEFVGVSKSGTGTGSTYTLMNKL